MKQQLTKAKANDTITNIFNILVEGFSVSGTDLPSLLQNYTKAEIESLTTKYNLGKIDIQDVIKVYCKLAYDQGYYKGVKNASYLLEDLQQNPITNQVAN